MADQVNTNATMIKEAATSINAIANTLSSTAQKLWAGVETSGANGFNDKQYRTLCGMIKGALGSIKTALAELNGIHESLAILYKAVVEYEGDEN